MVVVDARPMLQPDHFASFLAAGAGGGELIVLLGRSSPRHRDGRDPGRHLPGARTRYHAQAAVHHITPSAIVSPPG